MKASSIHATRSGTLPDGRAASKWFFPRTPFLGHPFALVGIAVFFAAACAFAQPNYVTLPAAGGSNGRTLSWNVSSVNTYLEYHGFNASDDGMPSWVTKAEVILQYPEYTTSFTEPTQKTETFTYRSTMGVYGGPGRLVNISVYKGGHLEVGVRVTAAANTTGSSRSYTCRVTDTKTYMSQQTIVNYVFTFTQPSGSSTVTVTFDKQGGTGGTTSVTATNGQAMPTITIPTRTGQTFGGYYTGTGGSGTQYYTGTGASARTWDKLTATTLYAKWTPFPAPTHVTATTNGLAGITVAWIPVDRPDAWYVIARSPTQNRNDGDASTETWYVKEGVSQYTDTTAEAGKTYYYWVCAVVTLDESSDWVGPVAGRRAAAVDLAFYRPADWPAAMFLSTSPASLSAATSFKLTDSVYLHFAYANDGSKDAGKHRASVKIEDSAGNTVDTWKWSHDSLSAGYYRSVTNDNIMLNAGGGATITAAGTYKATVTLILEDGNTDAYESDNSRSLTFTVAANASATPQTVWRFYSKNYKGHFFTISESEKNGLISGNPNWTYEGGAYRAHTTAASGTVALYRFYSKNYRGHFFTIDEREKENLRTGNPNWAYEGVAYYVYPTEVSGSVPVYRFWSKGYRHHFYTTSVAERDGLITGNPNWAYEGVAFWALPMSGAKGKSALRGAGEDDDGEGGEDGTGIQPRAVRPRSGGETTGDGATVTTCDGSDGSAVFDGNGETGWSPEGGSGEAWVALSFEEPVEVARVETVGENLPDGVRVLVSWDAEEWHELDGGEGTEASRYVWVAWEAGEGEGSVLKEIVVSGGEE